MFKKTLTAAVVALTLTGATLAPMQSAEARGLGRALAFGAAGFAVGALAVGAAAARPVYDGGCGYVSQPVVNAWGDVVAYRRVPAC